MEFRNEVDGEAMAFISYLRTAIILAARSNSNSSSDIDIDAIDKVVETTIDFTRNVLEQIIIDNKNLSLSPNDLLNTFRVKKFFENLNIISTKLFTSSCILI